MLGRIMRIFDCFTFFNELELLELRLMELHDHVDKFVLVESNRTHTGKEKQFVFEANHHLFSEYLDQIIYVKVQDLPIYDTDRANLNPDRVDWIPENFQRNCIMRGLTAIAADHDKILVSDLDEIPNVDTILKYRDCPEWVTFEQSLFYYYVNCLQNQKWHGTIMANYGTFELPQDLRNYARSGMNSVPNGGWHYSYMGGAQRIIQKVQNIAESSLIIDQIGNVDEIEKKMESQSDLWGRKDDFVEKRIVDISHNSPRKINEFISKHSSFYFVRNS